MSPREKLLEVIETLSDVQLENVLHYAEILRSPKLPEDYDPENDPAIGFFSADPDLGSRTKNILREEFGRMKPDEAKK